MFVILGFLILRDFGVAFGMGNSGYTTTTDMERTSRELLLFAIACFGVLMGAVGVILSSVPLAIFGLVILCLSLAGFAIKNWLGKA
jgi:hypothetical protein